MAIKKPKQVKLTLTFAEAAQLNSALGGVLAGEIDGVEEDDQERVHDILEHVQALVGAAIGSARTGARDGRCVCSDRIRGGSLLGRCRLRDDHDGPHAFSPLEEIQARPSNRIT